MKLELMNEEEQAKAFDLLCIAFPFYGDMAGMKPGTDSHRAWVYRADREAADEAGFCCVSYMLEAEG